MTGRGKAEELHQELLARLDGLTTSEDWRRALDCASRFHHYSFGNQLLIALQRSDASYVAGFNRWRELGRYVRKGEHGIGILAPMTFRKNVQDATTGEEATVTAVRGFRTVFVFDVSQTEGEALPLEILTPQLLDGDSDVWEALEALVEDQGFTVKRGPCGGANGVTMYGPRVVRVRDDVSPAQASKTLTHELAHVLLHDGSAYAMGCRGIVEVEAESVAYVVCRALGIDAGDYSLPYVAGWAGGKRETISKTGERVVRTAHEILSALEAAEKRVPVLV